MQLEVWQVMLCCKGKVVSVLLMVTSFTTFLPSAASPVNGHMGHLDLKPALIVEAVDLVLIIPSFGGNLALHSISFIFFPLLFTT